MLYGEINGFSTQLVRDFSLLLVPRSYKILRDYTTLVLQSQTHPLLLYGEGLVNCKFQ